MQEHVTPEELPYTKGDHPSDVSRTLSNRNGSTYLSNVSYFFVPFTFADTSAPDASSSGGKATTMRQNDDGKATTTQQDTDLHVAEALKEAATQLEQSPCWERVPDKLAYMFKYITDKIEGDKTHRQLCMHMRLAPGAAASLGLPCPDDVCAMTPRKHHGLLTSFRFRLMDVQMFCFSTQVCIVALKVTFDSPERLGTPAEPGAAESPNALEIAAAGSDGLNSATSSDMLDAVAGPNAPGVSANPSPLDAVANAGSPGAAASPNALEIAAAQYHLKKCSREAFAFGPENTQATLLDVAKRAVSSLPLSSTCKFFYYANDGQERSDVLTFLEVPDKPDYREELFYLRRCYNDGFTFRSDPAAETKEIYHASHETTWGITSEAAVCLTCPNRGKAEFIRGKFFNNFNSQYLFMYVFLLHQKYTLYHFLTLASSNGYDSLPQLKLYQQKLYEYEADFEYSRITEVPQYQNLYERIADAFALDQMFEDVREPLHALGELKKDAAERRANTRERDISRALLMLSFLVLFSALADSFDFAGNFPFLGMEIITALRAICIVFILAVAGWVVFHVAKSKGEE